MNDKMDHQPADRRTRTPRLFLVLLVLGAMVKVLMFVQPYFQQRMYPPALEHEDGTGFAIEEKPGGGYVYVDESQVASSTAVEVDSLTVLAGTSTIVPTTSLVPVPIATADPASDKPAYQIYRTTSFAAPVLNITHSGDTAPGLLFFGPRGNGTKSLAPLIMTQSGELVWHGPLGTTTNMHLQIYKGEPHIAFWNGTSAFTFGHGYGAVHILDSAYWEVAKICPQGLDLLTELESTDVECYLDMHESYITSRDTLVVTAYNITRLDLTPIHGPSNAWIFDSLFYEIDILSGDVLFRWRASDHLDQIPLNLTKQPIEIDEQVQGSNRSNRSNPFDFFHINSVQPLEDGGWLVNSRHTWSIFKLTAAGDVEWRFSGDDGGDFLFGLLGEDIGFSWQHHARAHNVTNSTMRLTLFDNGNSEINEGQPKTSRGLEIFLDREKGDSMLLRSWEDENDPRFSYAMGDVQSLPGGATLVGFGKDPMFKEFNRTEALVYSASFGSPVGEDVVASYRVYKFEWSALPEADPEVVAEYDEDADQTTIWASWNGATPDVFDGWRVSVGGIEEMTANDDITSRTGFETAISVRGKHQACQATALLASKPVRSSKVVIVTNTG